MTYRIALTVLAALTAAFAAPATHAQSLYLYQGGPDGNTYTANDATYLNGFIFTGLDSTFSSTDVNGIPHVSTLNVVNGGSVFQAVGFSTGTVNIDGGIVDRAFGNETSTTKISGGTLTNGFLLFGTGATANFVSTGLSFAYQSYGNSNPYSEFADFFRVSGTVGGTARTYNLYVRNGEGASGTPNSAPRQFTFNGASPVTVVVS